MFYGDGMEILYTINKCLNMKELETIFENRLIQIHELNRMGADIKLEGNTVRKPTCIARYTHYARAHPPSE